MAPAAVAPAGPAVTLTPDNVTELWNQSLEKISGMIVEQAKLFSRVEVLGPNRLAVSFPPRYSLARSTCQQPEQVVRFEQALAGVCGHTVRVEFLLSEPEPTAQEAVAAPRPVPAHQRLQEVGRHEMVRRAGELFGAHPVSVDGP